MSMISGPHIIKNALIVQHLDLASQHYTVSELHEIFLKETVHFSMQQNVEGANVEEVGIKSLLFLFIYIYIYKLGVPLLTLHLCIRKSGMETFRFAILPQLTHQLFTSNIIKVNGC